MVLMLIPVPSTTLLPTAVIILVPVACIKVVGVKDI